jgi:hypothetical protein
MSEKDSRPAKTGDAKWKEVRDGIASNNDEARKAGRVRRDAWEQTRFDARAKGRQIRGQR